MINLSIVLALALVAPLHSLEDPASLQGERPEQPTRHKTGIATMYTAETGTPLYCDQFMGPDGSLTYHPDVGPWVALDVGSYGDFAECGDWLLVVFDDGKFLAARAPDAGKFQDVQIVGYPSDTPLIIDVPDLWRHDWHLSWPVSVYNMSRWLKLALDKK